ncbi:ATP-binding protein [Sorangium sp. So ce429]
MRVLLVEDEERLAEAIASGLAAEGFAVDAVRSGADGLWRGTEGQYAAIILDILLPDLNGYEVCAALREREVWTPILMLTAKDGEYDVAEALDTGADDFLSKPFSYVVLVARLRALVRRGAAPRPAVLRVGDLELDPATRRCRRDGQDIALTPREFALLDALMRRCGEVVPKQRILDVVWGLDFPGVPPGPPRPAPSWSVVEMPIVSPADGPLTAIAMSPLDDVLRSTRTLTRVLAVGIPALVILLTAAAWVLIGRTLRPVRAMTLRAAGIADATTGERLAVPPTFDEVAELGRTLNGMLDRLADGARRQREFVSDASHELRSPIAAVRASLEVALAHPDRADASAVQRGVLAEILRLEALVADLLALAGLDEQRAPPHDEIDLDDVVLEEAARARAVPVDTRAVSAAKVRGDRRGLEHLVRNLLDNAARYAASRVIVTTEIDDREVVLRVDDDGPGIPEQDRARVFERFTRVASSRSRDAGGAGLGLALVQRITDQHGGAVRAGRSPQGGARLEVRLPALAAFCGPASAEPGSA